MAGFRRLNIRILPWMRQEIWVKTSTFRILFQQMASLKSCPTAMASSVQATITTSLRPTTSMLQPIKSSATALKRATLCSVTCALLMREKNTSRLQVLIKSTAAHHQKFVTVFHLRTSRPFSLMKSSRFVAMRRQQIFLHES